MDHAAPRTRRTRRALGVAVTLMGVTGGCALLAPVPDPSDLGLAGTDGGVASSDTGATTQEGSTGTEVGSAADAALDCRTGAVTPGCECAVSCNSQSCNAKQCDPMLVLTTPTTGDLSAHGSPDKLCEATATTLGLLHPERFKAFLALDAPSVFQRNISLSPDQPVWRPGTAANSRVRIADSGADLLAGNLTNQTGYGLDASKFRNAWSDVYDDGGRLPGGNCQSWANGTDTAQGHRGDLNVTTAAWASNTGVAVDCSTMNPVYCIESITPVK